MFRSGLNERLVARKSDLGRRERVKTCAGFYERIDGFSVQEVTENGYAPGLHTFKMQREMTADGGANIAALLAVLRIPFPKSKRS